MEPLLHRLRSEQLEELGHSPINGIVQIQTVPQVELFFLEQHPQPILHQ